MRSRVCAFSLVEILIALIVVSIAATNMYGLQQKVSQQQRNNINHTTAISLAIREMEKLLSVNNLEQFAAVQNKIHAELQLTNTHFSVKWFIKDLGVKNDNGGELKQVNLMITWLNSQSTQETFTLSQQISFTDSTSNLLEEEDERVSRIIFSEMDDKSIAHFVPNKTYKTGEFVIYNSYLYQAIFNTSQTPITSSGVAHGWKSYGQIDNVDSAL